MAHQSLYRAYRPQKFSEVAGQEQVTRPLSEAVKSKNIGHAYLFAGSRGLGKTSVARIFAKEIGCEGSDLYEIDAASSNSVEDIRELTENVYTLPFSSPYKVYILDEAHMLSKSAWNAFLKTLEEPPPHGVFILATTELERVPETVQSRCQVFEFKKPTRKALAGVVVSVAKQEGVAIASDAAELIALLAEASYRDALSVLQKVLIANPGKSLSLEGVELATGAPKRALVHALLSALAKGERAGALMAIEKASKSGADMRLFIELTIEAVRSTLLLRYAPDLKQDLQTEIGEDELKALEVFAKLDGVTHKTLLALINALDRARYAPLPVVPLELVVLELYP